MWVELNSGDWLLFYKEKIVYVCEYFIDDSILSYMPVGFICRL